MTRIDRTDVILAGKLATFLMVLAASLFLLVGMTRSALAAGVKDVAIISGDVVTAGDIFFGLERNADYVLGNAPAPGKDMVLSARTLYRVASALDIPWKPQSTAQQVIVRREAVIIPAADIEAQLMEELRASGATGDFRVSLNSTVEPIALPAKTPQTFTVSDLRFEPHKNYFEATIVAPSRDNPLQRITLAGEVERFVSLPVLKTTMKNGDIISHADLDYIDVSAKSLPRDIILDADKIAGMTPRRLALGGKPLAFNDVQSPQLVGRGEVVTLIYADSGMTVSTKGKSAQNATMGELVRVTNLNSNKAVSGVVTGLREITVQ